jgi:hypothetical protein
MASSNELHFSDPCYIVRLYPLRMDYSAVAHHNTVNLHDLADLCSEARAASWHSMFRSWNAVSTFMPLVQERLMCCTDDPELRLDACWERRPRGTLLDFGWTRENKAMPQAWSFFAYCKPEDLLTCLVDIMDTVAETENEVADEWLYPRHQPWKLVTIGQILHSLYRKRVLNEPELPDVIQYMQHILYVLAATELLNTFFKSRRTNVERLEYIINEEMWYHNAFNMDDVAKIQDLLSRPLSEIARLALHGERNLVPHYYDRSAAEAFDPKHLRLDLLLGIGGLKIEWTEYLHEHLTLNTSTLTLRIFWFASHIRQNPMFQ